MFSNNLAFGITDIQDDEHILYIRVRFMLLEIGWEPFPGAPGSVYFIRLSVL
jgi:hypothetical protein